MIDAARLRVLGTERLTALLERRPDTTVPPAPVSLTELADRLCQPRSVLAALRRLDRPTLQVAEALAALGGEAARADLDRLLGATSNDASVQPAGDGRPAGGYRRAEIDQALETLRDDALLTGRDRLRLIDGARHAWPSPLDLGDPAEELTRQRAASDLRALAHNLAVKPASRKAELLAQVLGALRDPDLVRRVVARAPAPARDLLLKVALTGQTVPDFTFYSPANRQPAGPVQWATARGLLHRAGNWGAELVMPAEVALALRGPDWTAPFDPVPPAAATVAATAAEVTRDAAAAGSAFLGLTTALLDEAGRQPFGVLKAGGVGTRELRRLAKRVNHAESEVRLGLAVAHGAGLLALSAEGATPTVGYDEWLRAEPAGRLAPLLDAWWSLPYAPTAGSDAAWLPVDPADGLVALRAAVLREAVGLSIADDPVAVNDPATLAELVLWRRPYAFGGPDPRRHAVACWREAALLGAVGAGAPSAAGRILATRTGRHHDGPDRPGDLLAALTELGTTERSVRLQTDLTALVTGVPSAELAELLDGVADREARGTASTWRFTPGSVRRALDAGRHAETLLNELDAVSLGGLPQPLDYLIRDVARRHGAVRGQEVKCCLRSDDPALLAEIAADRRLLALGLRALAPTVLAGAKPLAETLAGLRAAGYAPVAERADGTPVIERLPRQRAAAPAKARTGTPRRAGRHQGNPAHAPQSRANERLARPERADDLARALLDRPDVVALPSSPSLTPVRARAGQLTESQGRMLAYAIDSGLPVLIDYVNQAGNVSSRVIQDIELSGGTLLAWCRLRADERMFSLDRVLSVAAADEAGDLTAFAEAAD